MNKELTFRVDAKMARLLGEQSVSSNVAAIFELVKNGYDADADSVEVVFIGQRTEKNEIHVSRIEIKDDANGMTYEDLRDRWMVVGTDFKERETHSPLYHRRVVGAKGIGRFATQKIGSKVTIISDPRTKVPGRKTEYPDMRIILHLDWNRYQPGVTFDEIKLQTEIIDKPSKSEHGTRIVIEELRQQWTSEDIERLRERLSALVLPKEIAKEAEHPFEVKIIAEGFTLPDVVIESKLFARAPYAIRAKLKGERIVYSISKKGVKVDKKPDEEPIQVKGISCGDAEFVMYYYPQDKANLPNKVWDAYYKKVLGAERIREILNAHSGIKIYNDNVRILPYGEPGNDWLNLNTRQLKRFGEGRINNKSVIGFILLSRDTNPGIQETTTREALINNRAFEDLKTFVDKVIREFERYNASERENEDEEKKKVNHAVSAKSELHQLGESLKDMPINSEESVELQQKVTTVIKEINALETKHNEEIQEFIRSEEIYRNLASVGITTISFTHEIVDPLIGMDLKLTNLIDDLHTKLPADQEIQGKLAYLSDRVGNMLNWAQYIRGFGSLIAASGKMKRRTDVAFRATVEKIVEAYGAVFNENDIEMIYSIPDHLQTLKMNRPDLESIIVNLLTNSVKSLKQVEDRKRRIKIDVTTNGPNLLLRFSDNGIGIPKSDYERIFEAFYTTYSEPKKGIVGTGMGLSIIREILEGYDGKVEVDKSEWSPGATFLVTIPLEKVK